MTLFTEKGVFTKTTSTGVPVSQEINLSGAFQPKALILWTSGQTTSNGTYADHMLWSYGWSDGTNDVCTAMRSHETNENEATVIRNDAIISILSLTAGSEVSRASVTSFDSDGFTLSWDVQSDTSAMVIHYVAIGGTDITNVSAFQTSLSSFTTGNKSFNGSGTTFTPDFGLIMNGPDTGSLTVNTISSGADQSEFILGAAKDTTHQWVVAARDETVATSDNHTLLDNGNCTAAMSTSTGAVSFLGTFVSFNSAAGGGITINVTNAASNTTLFGFLLIKGGNWDANVFQQRSGTGTQNVSLTDSTVLPKLVSLMGINSATEGTQVANHYVGVGASDGTNEGNSFNGNTAGLATWITARSTDTGKVYRIATPAATATSSTTNAECDMNSMSTAGQFTLNWTTADTTQRQMAYWMVGVVPQAISRSLPTETVTVFESVGRTKSAPASLATVYGTISQATGYGQIVGAGATRRFMPGGGLFSRVTEAGTQVIYRTAGTASYLSAMVGFNLTTSTTTITLRINAADGNETISVSAGVSGYFQDITHTDTISAGDKLNLQVVAGATSNFALDGYSFIYDVGTGAKAVQRLAFNNSQGPLYGDTAAITYYLPIGGDNFDQAPRTTESEVKIRMRKALAVKNLMINTTTNNISGTSTFKSRKNGADGNLVVSVSSSATGWFEDTTHSDTVSAGDDYNYSAAIPSGNSGNILWLEAVAADFQSSTAEMGLALSLMLPPTDLSFGSIRYCAFSGQAYPWTFAELENIHRRISTRLSIGKATLSELTTNVLTNTVNAATTVTLRVNDVPSALTVSISSSTTGVFSDSTHTVNVYDTDFPDYVLNSSAATSGTMQLTYIETYYEVFRPSAGNNVTRSLATETVSVSESLVRLSGKIRTRSDTVSVSESVVRLAAKQRALSAQTVSVSESVVRTRGRLGRLGAETVSVSESLARLAAKIRTRSDTVAVSESLVRLSAKRRALSTQTVSVSESVTRVKGIPRALAAQTVSISDSLARLAAKIRTRNETVSVSESLSRLAAKRRSLTTETITVSDNVARVVARTVARALATETVAVSESLARLTAKIRTRSDTVTVSESLVRLAAKIRALSTQTISVSDSVDRTVTPAGGGNNVERSLATETVSVSESVSRLTNKIRALSTQTLSVSESRSRTKGITRTLATQTVSISGGTLTRVKGVIRALTIETVSVGETLARRTAKIRALSTQTVSVAENLAKQRGKIRALAAQTVAISENIARRTQKIRAIQEFINLIEQMRVFRNGVELLPPEPTFKPSMMMGGVPRLRPIKYPVYHTTDYERLQRRKNLRKTQKLVVFPAFSQQINTVKAPFVVTSLTKNRVTVRFAIARREPLFFVAKQGPIPVQIAAKTRKKEANAAHCASFVMSNAAMQKTIQSNNKRLGKLSKLMALFHIMQQIKEED